MLQRELESRGIRVICKADTKRIRAVIVRRLKRQLLRHARSAGRAEQAAVEAEIGILTGVNALAETVEEVWIMERVPKAKEGDYQQMRAPSFEA
ncbi:MAG: hypothetical protein HC900_10705, partial [Methylacidiphilales bacterium]|nr:hypothetical protein [Candidatus Methylacidiphilales bacterium]